MPLQDLCLHKFHPLAYAHKQGREHCRTRIVRGRLYDDALSRNEFAMVLGSEVDNVVIVVHSGIAAGLTAQHKNCRAAGYPAFLL